jgi:hypothetical protein
MARSLPCSSRGTSPRHVDYRGGAYRGAYHCRLYRVIHQSAFAPENLTTLAHFSVSAAIRVVGTPDKCVAEPQPAIRVYSNVEPASPKIPRPGDRSRMSTTWAKGPGSNGAPGLWALRSLTTRSRAADNSCLVIPVAMISATITSLTGPRISTTSSYDNSANSSLLSLSKAYSVPGALALHLLEKSPRLSSDKPRPVFRFLASHLSATAQTWSSVSSYVCIRDQVPRGFPCIFTTGFSLRWAPKP